MEDITLVCSAGGCIGGHLADPKGQGKTLRAVDREPLGPWYQLGGSVENRRLDIGLRKACFEAANEAQNVYTFVADVVDGIRCDDERR